jgi:hypothetical protein
MTLPNNFAQAPHEEPHRFFRNVCIQFRKVILTTKEHKQLEPEIENFINASKQMNWHLKPSETFRKDAGEKALQKVLTECERYYKALIADPSSATSQDLLDALSEVQRLIDTLKAT